MMKTFTSRSALGALVLAAGLACVTPSASRAEPFLIAQTETPAPQPGGDVLEVAAAQGQFQTFLEAVRVAGYEDTLRGEGPFTIFAPTDEAFEQMDDAELERLMEPQAREELLA